jgi:hypothetical protein
MSIFTDFAKPFTEMIADRITLNMANDPRIRDIIERRAYRVGAHKQSLKRSATGHNDNATLNFTGLIVNRAVSQTIGQGITYKFEGDDTQAESPQKVYVTAALNANHQELLFHRSLLFSCEGGTGYWLLVPDAMVDTKGGVFPRIVVLDPAFMTIKTKFGDFEVVESYTCEYKDMDPVTGKEVGYRKVIARDFTTEAERWTITDYTETNGVWKPLTPPVVWPWDFSPVLHWQNAPSTDSVYGMPDITEDLEGLQDQLNFCASNINRIIRMWASPQLVINGFTGDTSKLMGIGPDQALILPKEATASLLSPVGDLPGALNQFAMLKKAFFDVARMVDVETLDASGQLTNFGMRVRYQDNLNKIETKRELFGDAVEELCRRLQVMAGLQPAEVEVMWSDWMPVNETELMQATQTKLDIGVESKQTAAEELGLDWEQEQERIGAEQQATDNIGATMLRMFNRGGGGANLPQVNPAETPPMV